MHSFRAGWHGSVPINNNFLPFIFTNGETEALRSLPFRYRSGLAPYACTGAIIPGRATGSHPLIQPQGRWGSSGSLPVTSLYLLSFHLPQLRT